MKKLLALILCVMMFVSVLSTSAFAANTPVDQWTWNGAGTQKDIIERLHRNIENMYGTIAADKYVYDSVKGIDDLITGLVSDALKDYAPTATYGVAKSTLEDTAVAALRATVGGEISKYLVNHVNEYYDIDKDGNSVFNPVRYANVFGKAVSGALSSEKAILGFQGYMYLLAQRSAYANISMQARDLYNSMASWGHWGDYGFDDADSTNADGGNNYGIFGNWETPLFNENGTMNDVHAVYAELLAADALGHVFNGQHANGVGVADATGAAASVIWDDSENLSTYGTLLG